MKCQFRKKPPVYDFLIFSFVLQLDTFQLMAVDLGKLVKLKVRHDNKGVGAAWYLDKIEVEDSKRKKMYVTRT